MFTVKYRSYCLSAKQPPADCTAPSAFYDEHELIEARNVTTLTKPTNVRAFFQSRLRKIIPSETVNAERRPSPLKPLPVGDPYGS